MDVEYLREFSVLAKTCQFSEAADQLHMSQSSLSKHIKALEDELQAPLFERSTRRASLSIHGRNLLPYARQIVMVYDEYFNLYSPEKFTQYRDFFIGMVPALSMKYFCNFLEELMIERPNYNIDFIVHEVQQLLTLLVEGKLDMLFVRDCSEIHDDSLTVVPYLDDYLVAVVPAKHPLASKKEITASDLLTLPRIKLGKDNLPEFFDKSLYKSKITVGRTGEMMHLVSAGMGIGILPYRTAAEFRVEGIKIIPLFPRTDIQLDIVYRRNSSKDTAIIQEFLEYIKSHPRENADSGTQQPVNHKTASLK